MLGRLAAAIMLATLLEKPFLTFLVLTISKLLGLMHWGLDVEFDPDLESVDRLFLVASLELLLIALLTSETMAVLANLVLSKLLCSSPPRFSSELCSGELEEGMHMLASLPKRLRMHLLLPHFDVVLENRILEVSCSCLWQIDLCEVDPILGIFGLPPFAVVTILCFFVVLPRDNLSAITFLFPGM